MDAGKPEPPAEALERKPFIDPDEHIIAVDMPSMVLSADDMKRLRDVGIKTIWANLNWFYVEPRMGQYEWQWADTVVQRACEAGMKVGLTTPASGPIVGPDDWYLRMPNGDIWRAYSDGFREAGYTYSEFSPWCDEAMAYERAFIEKVRARYPMNVQLVNGNVHGGELILPGMTECWYDRHALDSFRRFARGLHGDSLVRFNRMEHTHFQSWDEVRPCQFPTRGSMQYHPTTTKWLHDTLIARMLSRQAIFAAQPWRETWIYTPERTGDFAENFETGPRSCNWLANEMFETFPERLDTSLNIIFFEVYRQQGQMGILDGVRGFEDRVWVGSQYCQGLQLHTHDAIARGLRGFITGPLHFEQGERSLQPWMLEVIQWSLREFAAAGR